MQRNLENHEHHQRGGKSDAPGALREATHDRRWAADRGGEQPGAHGPYIDQNSGRPTPRGDEADGTL
jgi:hypothetical protein